MKRYLAKKFVRKCSFEIEVIFSNLNISTSGYIKKKVPNFKKSSEHS